MIILLIKIILVTYFFTRFEPIQDGIDLLWAKMPEKITGNYFVDKIYILLGCMKCLTLWVTLIVTGNIFLAIGNSMIAELIKKIIR